jgi:hypothetical protein
MPGNGWGFFGAGPGDYNVRRKQISGKELLVQKKGERIGKKGLVGKNTDERVGEKGKLGKGTEAVKGVGVNGYKRKCSREREV